MFFIFIKSKISLIKSVLFPFRSIYFCISYLLCFLPYIWGQKPFCRSLVLPTSLPVSDTYQHCKQWIDHSTHCCTAALLQMYIQMTVTVTITIILWGFLHIMYLITINFCRLLTTPLDVNIAADRCRTSEMWIRKRKWMLMVLFLCTGISCTL